MYWYLKIINDDLCAGKGTNLYLHILYIVELVTVDVQNITALQILCSLHEIIVTL